LRDRGKRPMMGEIAGRLADFSVITAEDPRTERPKDICQQIAEGCRQAGAQEKNVAIDNTIVGSSVTKKDIKNVYFIIPDRQEAINFALQKLAQKDDIVVVCGKGHERSMCFGKREYPWSDQEAVRKALRKVSETPASTLASQGGNVSKGVK